MVRALYDYAGSCQEELSFVDGTIFKLLRRDENGIDDGFWEGELNGKIGVFPSLLVEELDSESRQSSNDVRSSSVLIFIFEFLFFIFEGIGRFI